MSGDAVKDRAIVIGGGLHGTSTALHLAQKGLDVLVFEKNAVGRHASGVNAGGVRQLRRHPAEIPLSVAAMDRWLHLDTFLDPDLALMCEFTGHTGQVAVAETEADMAGLVAREAELRRLGWTHEELLDQAELRRVAPAVAPHCVGGLISRRDGYANPFRTSQAFRLKAQRSGVRFREGTRVLGLAQTSGGWRVETEGDTWDCGVVVNCGGAWGWQVAEMVGEVLPRGYFAPSMMVTARMPRFLAPVVLGVGRKLSFKQMENGTVVIGGGIPGIPDLDAETAEPVMERMTESARTVCDLFPIMRNATIVRTWAGLEARMPDEIPVIGPSTTVPGLWHAFGFSGHGFQLSPIVGALLADMIVDGHSSLPLEPFRAGRFNEGAVAPAPGVAS
jgi:sarcosine oxidase subunit beta